MGRESGAVNEPRLNRDSAVSTVAGGAAGNPRRSRSRRALYAVTPAILTINGAPGSAQAVLRGPEEPGVTRPVDGQNTWWTQWARPSFTPFYQVCYDVYRDGGLVATGQCTANLAGVGPDNQFQWSVIRRPVDSGHRWRVCATELLGNPATGTVIRGDFVCSGPTLIDATPPESTIELNGGVPTSRSTKVPLKIRYRDALSAPFPTSAGGATFICESSVDQVIPGQRGKPQAALVPVCKFNPPETWHFEPSCSHPAMPALVTTFSCRWSSSDGRWRICVSVADGAFADRPDSAEQLSGDARRANLSIPSCAVITIDTRAPRLNVNVPRRVHARRRTTLTAEISESGSGLQGAPLWRFGDGKRSARGVTVRHTWRRPGRYELAVAVRDLAGNRGSKRRSVTVIG